MKNIFPAFYTPDDQEFSNGWKDCTFVLDTNILLNLYRLPIAASDQYFGVLEKIKDRLWIPHQVGLEFQRMRIGVISGERKKLDESFIDVSNAITSIKSRIDSLELEKRGLNISNGHISDLFKIVDEKLLALISKAQEAQLDISSKDPIRDRLDSLLDGRIGVGPADMNDINSLIADGELRYANNLPPGFKDSGKNKDQDYYYNGLIYPAKFGDLIIWRQLLNHANKFGLKKVVYVTGDRKEDWWRIEKGRHLGPHPELINEIKRLSSVDFFWMYSAESFIEKARDYLHASVSPETLAEVKNVSSSEINIINNFSFEEISPNANEDKYLDNLVPKNPGYNIGALAKAIIRLHSNAAHISGIKDYTILIDDNGSEELYLYKNFGASFPDDLIPRVIDDFSRNHLIYKPNSNGVLFFNLIIIIKITGLYRITYFQDFINSMIDSEEKKFNIKFKKIIIGYYDGNDFSVAQLTENRILN